MGEKALLETQIKAVITSLTSEIRNQANAFKWDQFKYI
jgi:hypothetical protein